MSRSSSPEVQHLYPLGPSGETRSRRKRKAIRPPSAPIAPVETSPKENVATIKPGSQVELLTRQRTPLRYLIMDPEKTYSGTSIDGHSLASPQSLIGKSLLKKSLGDRIEVEVPMGRIDGIVTRIDLKLLPEEVIAAVFAKVYPQP